MNDSERFGSLSAAATERKRTSGPSGIKVIGPSLWQGFGRTWSDRETGQGIGSSGNIDGSCMDLVVSFVS